MINRSATMKKHRKLEARKRINLLHSQAQTLEAGQGLMELHLQLEALEKEFSVYTPTIENTDNPQNELAVS
jgi:hypothetical protein